MTKLDGNQLPYVVYPFFRTELSTKMASFYLLNFQLLGSGSIDFNGLIHFVGVVNSAGTEVEFRNEKENTRVLSLTYTLLS